MTAKWLTAVAALVLAGCGRTEPTASSAQVERSVESITHFGPRTELFVEFPALVVGLDSSFAAHLTTLADFKPLAAGRVTVVLGGPQGAEERFEVAAPTAPGIFRPIARPVAAGERQLTLEVAITEGVEHHGLGTVTVAASVGELPKPTEDTASHIAFLKEQQWRTEFATASVGKRALRPAVTLNGSITARADGEAFVVAPSAGRLVARDSAFPHLGMQVRRDQVLAGIAPRLGSEVDLASLELAMQEATIASDHARRDRQRLEKLLAEQAVPERRALEARREEASAQATLIAARRRLDQFRGTQRAAASERSSMIELRSPIDGTVVAVSSTPGVFVEDGRELFRLVDLGRVWLQVHVPEGDLARIPEARGAWFIVDGFAQPFEVESRNGRLVALGGVIDPRTRTAPLVFELDNSDGALRIGMFARVHVLTGEPSEGLAIPVSAVIDDAGQHVAYIQVGGESFERRILRLGIRDGQWVEVRDGLAAGERVVTHGAYQLRLAAASGSLPAHGHVH